MCKSNLWTGGNEVYRANSQLELETYIHKLFETNRWLCICPYYQIQNEYRIIVLNSQSKLVYNKIRQYIIWDWSSTVLELIAKQHPKIKLSEIDFWENISLDKVLSDSIKLNINRKHNLWKWWKLEIIKDDKLIYILSKLAIEWSNAIDINFASVDIADLWNGLYKIIEINSGIMMEKFAQNWPQEYQIAKDIYNDALIYMLE